MNHFLFLTNNLMHFKLLVIIFHLKSQKDIFLSHFTYTMTPRLTSVTSVLHLVSMCDTPLHTITQFYTHILLLHSMHFLTKDCILRH